MTDLRAAAEQVLEAWDNDENGTLDHPLSDAMETLRSALEQRHFEWQVLTDEEIDSLWRKWVGTQRPNYSFTRAIESKLKEKNHE